MKKQPVLTTVLFLLLVALVPLMSGCTATTNQVSATVLSTGAEGYSDAAKAADEALAAITRSPDIEVPSDLITPGVLTIVSDAAYPPLEFLARVVTQEAGQDEPSETTQLVGFEVDLSMAVAKKLGLDPTYVQMGFNRLPDVLADGETVDMAASGMVTTPELLAQFVPSNTYLSADLAICTAADVQLPDAASLQGKIVGVQTGSSAESVAEGIEGIAELRLFPHVAGAFADLRDGKIDALIVLEPVAGWILLTEDYAGALAVSGTIPTDQGYAFWCNKDDQTLIDAVNAALEELMQASVSQPEATTTTGAISEGTTTTQGVSTTVVEGTSTTEAAGPASKSVYELLLDKWGLAGE